MASRTTAVWLVDGSSCSTRKIKSSQKKLGTKSDKPFSIRVSLEGICRIFSVSMTWLLQFIDGVIADLPDDLNATVTAEGEELEVAILELDEQWSFVGSKKNQQWLWLVFHSATRQVLAMHVGKRNRQSAETLLKKVPEDLKKKPSFTRIGSLCTTKFFLGGSTTPSEKSPERQVTLNDLTTLSGNGAPAIPAGDPAENGVSAIRGSLSSRRDSEGAKLPESDSKSTSGSKHSPMGKPPAGIAGSIWRFWILQSYLPTRPKNYPKP